MAKNPKTGLTDKQEQFCREYLTDFNATAAYIRAGYAVQSEASANAAASRLLVNVKVQAYLAGLRDQTEKRSVATLERTIDEISRVAFANITNVLSFGNDGVVFEDSNNLSSEVTAAIESVTMHETSTSTGEGGEIINRKQSLKMHNKMAALGLLADHFGIREDFNKARATLKRFGLALVPDSDSDLGWKVEAYAPSSDPDAA